MKIEQQKVQEEIHRVKREKAETRMTQLTIVRITSGYTHINTHTIHIDPHTYIPHTSQAYATHLPIYLYVISNRVHQTHHWLKGELENTRN